jgi:hypothetical protein
MLDALLATIGTLGVLASIAFKLRAPRGDAGTDAAEDAARSDMPRGCPRRRLRRRRR